MAETVKQLPPRPQAEPRASDPDPFEDGVGYLKARGWRCLGSVNGVGWLDPSCPEQPTYRKEKARALNRQTGQLEDVIADDGLGTKRVVEQTIYEGPAEPMSLQQALLIQIGRDRKVAETQRKTA